MPRFEQLLGHSKSPPPTAVTDPTAVNDPNNVQRTNTKRAIEQPKQKDCCEIVEREVDGMSYEALTRKTIGEAVERFKIQLFLYLSVLPTVV
jgi:hypothetical protein